VKQQGFSLIEMLLAVAISSVLMMAVGKMLPLLQRDTLQLQLRVQLQEELLQLVLLMEKAVRRAGYCHGVCSGEALQIQPRCLLVRWDENSNGKWEGSEHAESERWGYRLRNQSLEVLRGASGCEGTGWERISDPRIVVLDELQLLQQQQTIRIVLSGHVRQFPQLREQTEQWSYGGNL
jgi:prepilin peptidase dependent protein B